MRTTGREREAQRLAARTLLKLVGWNRVSTMSNTRWGLLLCITAFGFVLGSNLRMRKARNRASRFASTPARVDCCMQRKGRVTLADQHTHIDNAAQAPTFI